MEAILHFNKIKLEKEILWTLLSTYVHRKFSSGAEFEKRAGQRIEFHPLMNKFASFLSNKNLMFKLYCGSASSRYKTVPNDKMNSTEER